MKTFSGPTKYSSHPLKLNDVNASLTLQSKPGERVRMFFVNASINNPVAFHPTNNAIVDHAMGAAITVLMKHARCRPQTRDWWQYLDPLD